MPSAEFVDIKRSGGGGSSRPGWRGISNLRSFSARRQTANQRPYLRVIGPCMSKISTNEAKKRIFKIVRHKVTIRKSKK